ncbi:MAG: hypothetical protein ABI361_04465 [Nitrososphaera sp.]|jgi:hypothetical protein
MQELTRLLTELRANVESNRASIEVSLSKSPNMAYRQVNELAKFVGLRHSLDLQLHFPNPASITDVSSYGSENVGIVFDKFKRNFPIPRDVIKQKAAEVLGSEIKAQDAYMYEGKEGVRVIIKVGQRIEILPGSVHFWCKIDSQVRDFGDWLLENVYAVRK